jgi:hypothetical protein
VKHIFDVDIAAEYGINAAVLFENICYWIKQNEANETNFFDGDYWTYNSKKAFAELFPYMSEKQVRTALDKLIESNLIKTGNYNKLAYDRTLWYALTQKGKCIGLTGQMDCYKKANANASNVQPIPNINTDINSTNKQQIKKERKNNSYDVILSTVENEDLKGLYYEYIKMRKLIKSPMTDRALTMLINKVNELEPYDVERQKKLIETAIMNNWKSVYPLKEETKPAPKQADKPETNNPFLNLLMEEGETF